MPTKRPTPSYCPPKQSIAERPPMNSAQALALSEMFKDLANDSRLKLLHVLVRAGELCVTDLAAALGMNLQAVSSQLRGLSARGIVGVRRSGTSRYYRVVDPCVVQLMDQGLCLQEDSLAEGLRILVTAFLPPCPPMASGLSAPVLETQGADQYEI